MSRITKPKKRAQSEAASELTMRLYASGMSLLHRAGLGGLACTLHAMQKRYDNDSREGYDTSWMPGSVVEGQFPWEITDDTITLKFGEPESASDYLNKLFAFAFQLTASGLIYMPGQFEQQPSEAILADLQTGLLLTFLQHCGTHNLDAAPSQVTYGDEAQGLTVEFRRCSRFKNQSLWEKLVDNQGRINSREVSVDGSISPGSVIRHQAYSETTMSEPVSRALPLYFAPVGCMSMPVNRRVGVLVVPEVKSLLDFIEDRPAMSPTTAEDASIANGADAGFRAQARLRNNPRRSVAVQARMQGLPACYAMTFMPTVWASQQKSRVATITVEGDMANLDKFLIARALLPPRIVTRTVTKSTGRGKNKVQTERQETYRVDSVVRPLIAENLALGRKWYAGFVKLMTKINPATDQPYRDRIGFESEGLHAMIAEDVMWDEVGERRVVEAVHEAIRQRLGQIREETDGDKPLSQATKNRWERFREKLRLDLAGAKTEAHVRFALVDLFSRGGNNSVLREHWGVVLPVLRKNWQLARDLGLLALASYRGRETEDNNSSPKSLSTTPIEE